MSRIWESAERATRSYAFAVGPHVVDIRDDRDEVRLVNIRADGDHVVLTLAIDSTTDLELRLNAEAARRLGAALDDACRP
jgi:hypothetical protein